MNHLCELLKKVLKNFQKLISQELQIKAKDLRFTLVRFWNSLTIECL